jgi:predicted glycosyltransferase
MTAAESALLGTPSVFINSIDLGYLNELENRYELVTQISPDVNSDTIARTIIKLLTENKESVWSKRRRRILDEKEDMTALALSHIIGND